MSEVVVHVGRGTNVDISLAIDNGDTNAPKIRYNAAGSYWQISDDGTNFYRLSGTSSGATGTWQDPWVLGGATGGHLWYDVSNVCFRGKAGSAPGSETDGQILAFGGMQ